MFMPLPISEAQLSGWYSLSAQSVQDPQRRADLWLLQQSLTIQHSIVDKNFFDKILLDKSDEIWLFLIIYQANKDSKITVS